MFHRPTAPFIPMAVWMLSLVFPASLPAQQQPSRAVTVDITDGPIPSHKIGAMQVMGAPCFYGDHFHYELTAQGELRVHGPIICGSFKGGGGGEQVCRLDAQLTCRALSTFTPAPGLRYVVNAQGVRAGSTLYPWAAPQQAAAVLPLIRGRADSP
jgi:hypothetical protein